MSATWRSDSVPEPAAIGPAGWARVALRGGALGLFTVFCLVLMLAVRAVERPVYGAKRPWTSAFPLVVCRVALAVIGIGYRRRGTPLTGPGAIVANHSSWLDIFALNAGQRVQFVSKSEVAGWPAIGFLARAAGTVFIARDRRRSKDHQAVLAGRLAAGQRLAFFPEGTSTDGRRVLGFKSTLFAALHGAGQGLRVQPVAVVWHPPPGAEARFYGWWGDMDFGPHLLKILAAPRQGAVELIYHPSLAVDGFADRKALARACEAAVREGFRAAHPDPA